MKRTYKLVLYTSVALMVAALFTWIGFSNLKNDYKTSEYNYYYRVGNCTIKIEDYQGIEDAFAIEMSDLGYKNIHIYESSELDIMKIKNRKPNETIIERCIGLATDDFGDGEIINDGISGNEFSYISYKSVDVDVPKGTIVLTYLVYNPKTQYEDDIVERYDFPLISNAR